MFISVFEMMLKIWSKLYFFTCCVSFFGEYIFMFYTSVACSLCWYWLNCLHCLIFLFMIKQFKWTMTIKDSFFYFHFWLGEMLDISHVRWHSYHLTNQRQVFLKSIFCVNDLPLLKQLNVHFGDMKIAIKKTSFRCILYTNYPSLNLFFFFIKWNAFRWYGNNNKHSFSYILKKYVLCTRFIPL